MSVYYIFSILNKTEMLGLGEGIRAREGNREFTVTRSTTPYIFGTFFFKLFELLSPIFEDAAEHQSNAVAKVLYNNPSVYLEDCFSKFTGFDSYRSNEVFAEIIREVFSKELEELSSSKYFLGDYRPFLARYFRFKNELINAEKLNPASVSALRNEFFSDCAPLAKSLISPVANSENIHSIEKNLERIKREGTYALSDKLLFQENRKTRLFFQPPINVKNRTIPEERCESPYLVYKVETLSDLVLATLETEFASQRKRIQTCEVCGSLFFAGRADAKYCYWRCPTNPIDSKASCAEQVHNNKKLLRDPTSKLSKKIHSNSVSFSNRYFLSPPEREQNSWDEKEAYYKDAEAWKQKFELCQVTKEEFYQWLCAKVPLKSNTTHQEPS